MSRSQRPAQLAKLLAYVLGRHPDAFGLVPSPDGWVRIKDLLRVLSEEEGWRHIRRGHIEALRWERTPAAVEIAADRVRALDRSRLRPPAATETPPGRLFTCVRRRAYPRVRENGAAAPPPGIVLTAARDLALRIGRRRDPQPVLLEVRPPDLSARGVALQRFGEHLYLAERLPPDCFTGPPPPRELPPPASRTAPPPPPTPPHPGSFLVDLAAPPPQSRRAGRGKHQEPEWKRQRRRKRRRPAADE